METSIINSSGSYPYPYLLLFLVIYYRPSPERRLDDQSVRVIVTFQVIWRDYDDIHRGPYPIEIPPYPRAETSAIGHIFHDEEIHIAVRPHIPAGSGPEQDNLFRLGDLYDTLDYVIQCHGLRAVLLARSNEAYGCGFVENSHFNSTY